MSDQRSVIQSPAKKIYYKDDVRKIFLEGVNGVVDAVKSTLGPNGRIVTIYHSLRSPEASKDGVTVARSIQFADEAKNAAARYVIEAAMKTVVDAGDGTTTCSILTQSIYSEAIKHINKGANPVKIKKHIEEITKEAVELIKETSIEVKGNMDLIYNVAKVSSNNNDKVAALIMEAVQHVGVEGNIELQDSKDSKTTVELITGCDIDQGYILPAFQNTERATVEYENALVCVIDDDAISHKELDKLFGIIIQQDRPLLIIANEFNQDVLSVMIYNLQKGNIKICPVRGPGYGDRRREYLRDICAITDATLIGGNESGISVENIKPEHLGGCEKFVVKKNRTTIVGGDGDQSEIDHRLKRYKTLLNDAEEELNKTFLNKQISRLEGGVASIKVGGTTQTEQKELKYLVEDALLATKAAGEEGVNVGGGVSYYRAAQKLLNRYQALQKPKNSKTEESIALSIVCGALKSIIRQLSYNGGHDTNHIISEMESSTGDYGFNCKSEKFEYLLPSIIDSTKVQRCALENAVSITCVMIASECLIVNDLK